MYKFIKMLCLTCVLAVSAFAQTQADEYRKNEFYVGYSNQQIDADQYRTANGFQGSYVRNFHKYAGIKADVSGSFRGDRFEISLSDTNGAYSYRGRVRNSVYNFLGGIQVKNNKTEARFKPFAHALAGVAVTSGRFSALTCTSGTCPSFVGNSAPFSFTTTKFAAAIGGGLDIRINDRVDFRAFQVDYNPIFRGGVQHNIRIGVGVVFK